MSPHLPYCCSPGTPPRVTCRASVPVHLGAHQDPSVVPRSGRINSSATAPYCQQDADQAVSEELGSS